MPESRPTPEQLATAERRVKAWLLRAYGGPYGVMDDVRTVMAEFDTARTELACVRSVLTLLVDTSGLCSCGHDRYDDHDTAGTYCAESHLDGCAGEMECGCEHFEPVVTGAQIRAALEGVPS